MWPASVRARALGANGPGGPLLAVMLLVGVGGCVGPARSPGVRVRLSGAQVAVEYVASWLESAPSGGFAVQQVYPVYLSQHGFENLERGECDLACTDRPLSARERQQLFGERDIRGQRIAFYGYALYVNKDNPVDAIFSRHVKLVFQQKIKDWHELVGDQIPNWQGPIELFGPPKGTRAGQVLSPLARIWFADATWTEVETDAGIVAKVAENPYALGFASIGYDQGVRYLGLRLDRTSAPAFPSLEEIESERYGLAKVIYVYGEWPLNPAARAVLDFLQGDDGRAAIESTDVWALPAERAKVPDEK